MSWHDRQPLEVGLPFGITIKVPGPAVKWCALMLTATLAMVMGMMAWVIHLYAHNENMRRALDDNLRPFILAYLPDAQFGSVDNAARSFGTTALFAVPDSVSNDHEASVEVLHGWLLGEFAGYTRWRVEGGFIDPSSGQSVLQGGWVYQASRPVDREEASPMSSADIRAKLAELFGQSNEWYVILTPHRFDVAIEDALVDAG